MNYHTNQTTNANGNQMSTSSNHQPVDSGIDLSNSGPRRPRPSAQPRQSRFREEFDIVTAEYPPNHPDRPVTASIIANRAGIFRSFAQSVGALAPKKKPTEVEAQDVPQGASPDSSAVDVTKPTSIFHGFGRAVFAFQTKKVDDEEALGPENRHRSLTPLDENFFAQASAVPREPSKRETSSTPAYSGTYQDLQVSDGADGHFGARTYHDLKLLIHEFAPHDIGFGVRTTLITRSTTIL